MKRPGRRCLLILSVSVLGLILLVLGSITLALRGSLPRLEGEIGLEGLQRPVTVSRDALGVPDIQASSRLDCARALGYLHGQERFFQMDLQRRNAAGELAELLGASLLKTDRQSRIHRFRQRAGTVLASMSPEDRELLQVYADGVNAGLEDLRVRPFEYLILQKQPAPWIPADTVLALYAMFLDLSLSTAFAEQSWADVRDNLTPALTEFLIPRANRWEAPLQTEPVSQVEIPDSNACDIRNWKYGDKSYLQYRQDLLGVPPQDTAGSNCWAIAGELSTHGGAILANDMHLGLGLPNIWYQARMSWPEGEGTRSVVGVTLPGTPVLVAGSNGDVAWGFTVSYGDWADLVLLETDPADSTRYLTPEGWRSYERIAEIIPVSKAQPDTLWVEETIWGPVWKTDTKGRRLALRWTAHDPDAANIQLRQLESVSNVDEVLTLAPTVGIPQLNLVCADDQGRIAWTILGPIPRRIGWDGRLPVSWADGSCRWEGFLSLDDHPAIADPLEGRIWTANNRVTAGEFLGKIGDGGYAMGARARQIRDDLRELDRATEKDMLAIQLDDRAKMLEPWREMLLDVLEKIPPEEGSPRADFLRVIRDDWEGRALVESVSYFLMRNFVNECVDELYGLLTAVCKVADPDFHSYWLPHRRAVVWEVLQNRPPHLLPPWADDWDDFMFQRVDEVMEATTARGAKLEDFTWGSFNQVSIAHPFTMFAPWLSRWLAAPVQALPGDSAMPRVQGRRHGASERLVVSPGREEEGIFHMPGGQSGHPMSPFFLAGHEAWVKGEATPLLPGEERYRLVLVP